MRPIPYRPPFYLGNGHVQTILASLHLRARGANPMLDAARQHIVETGGGVRLLGSFSQHSDKPPRGLAVLLPGWEGSIDSSYMLCSGRTLFTGGYDVFRLNFRDHGASHHLNRGIFYASRLAEVFDAVSRVCALAPGRPAFLAGFSLGGNFALRTLRRAATHPIPNLRLAVAVSPALDPEASTRRADRHPLIRRYFLKKWRRSLRLKERLYPDLYDFRDLHRLPSIMATTEALLRLHGEYRSAREYFQTYTLTGEALKELPLPATLITAADDPIIPVADFRRLACGPSTRVVIHRRGGHNGFLKDFRLRSWVEREMIRMFDAACN
jgi:predicted alpha/beta-fold hydrolase